MTDQTPTIEDNFGRRFPYLRLSITDVCNFKCDYCLPDGYQKPDHEKGKKNVFLTREEILRVVRAFAGLGMWKLRLTGGEPTVRKDFPDIVRDVAAVDGIKKLAFTTNGYKLPDRAREFYEAGLRAVNISTDTLNRQKFKDMTGHDRLSDVLDGIDAALDAGFEAVKVNTVLLKEFNGDELDSFISFVRDKPISLRFIELMQTGQNNACFRAQHLPGTFVQQRLKELGWSAMEREIGAGPAIEYTHPDSQGRVGVIAPYAKDFCATCNRLRISARGKLHLCLFGTGGYDLRPLMQSDDQIPELQQTIQDLMRFKRSSHFLQQGDTGSRQHFASIGG